MEVLDQSKEHYRDFVGSTVILGLAVQRETWTVANLETTVAVDTSLV